MEKDLNQSLYEILEVAPDAPQEEIHQAFLRAKHTYSSDSPALYSVFTKDEADELLRLIEDAYAVLGNPLKRKEYDDKISGRPPAPAKDRDPKPKEFLKPVPNPEAPKLAPEMLTDSDVWGDAKVSNKPGSPPSPTDSIGRTALSNFDVNHDFEAEISAQQIWDGSFIQKVREYKNISIDQLTKYTRIGRHYLVALEANDFHSLPAQVFVRGFVAQISRLLNLNEKIVTDSYMKIFKESRGK
jgi:curved DNA-binding protein CbpA